MEKEGWRAAVHRGRLGLCVMLGVRPGVGQYGFETV